MATTKSQNHTRNSTIRTTKQAEQEVKEITHDVVEYLTDYARQNPGYAALCCMGVGFVLGWKLKPW